MRYFKFFFLLSIFLTTSDILAEKSKYQPLANWKNEIIYAVIVDRFFDGDPANNGGVANNIFDFQGGDLYGLILKLDYLKSLGVTAIVLSPITNSKVYHGYHPLDLKMINPKFGSLRTFQDLLYQAHIRGIKIIFDLVLNHMSEESDTFKYKPDWFRKKVGLAARNEGRFPEINSVVSFYNLPDINHQNEEVFQYQKEVAFFWIDQGIDGFRMDAVNQIEPEYWKKLNQAIKSYAGKDFFILGEHFEELTDLINVYAPYFDAFYDFQFYHTLDRILKLNASPHNIYFSDEIRKNINNKDLLLIPFADNHDVSRFMSDFRWVTTDLSKDLRIRRFKQALTLIFTRPGPPYLLYGSEIPLEDNTVLKEKTAYDAARSKMIFNNNQSSEIFTFIQSLSKVRKSLNWNNVEQVNISRYENHLSQGFINGDKKVIVVYSFNLSNARDFRISLRGLKQKFPQDASLQDINSGEKISIKNGLFDVQMPASGVRLFNVLP